MLALIWSVISGGLSSALGWLLENTLMRFTRAKTGVEKANEIENDNRRNLADGDASRLLHEQWQRKE